MSNGAQRDGKRDAYAGATRAHALALCFYSSPPNKADYVEAFMAEVAILDEVAKDEDAEIEEQAECELNMLTGGLDECGFTDDQVAALRTVFGRLLER
mgnify:CR=1 FL=1